MQHIKNVGKERRAIAPLPLFATVLLVWLLKFSNGLLQWVHWNGFNKNEMKQLTIKNRCIFKFYSRGISCSFSDNEKEQVKGDSSPLQIGWNHHFLRIQHVDSNICREQLILMYDATDLSDENEKLTHYS